MKPIVGKYVDNGYEVHGTILAFLDGNGAKVGVFMPDASKGDFTRLKKVPIEHLYAKKI